ncbi:tRNA lysidine(34) synthetase TilS [Nocardioides cavernaquae]|uniref:tRNA(Ile)-lysidine synthase n=1 Tax=Nocardioides cavernaquae TaxID=2321396 RepID=A0A3A5HDM0_9ACTN|nr:tRNA lysidine(34) synthetase TilS [Nocardioides cavernaquae]RJS46077.1 tRNA lysidine(34) synthetase TilS [Nocardioides cavernaquae]
MGLHPAVAACRLAVRREVTNGAPRGQKWRAEASELAPRTVLVACSGGADSLALLAATVFETRRTATSVIGAVVDHGLQDGSVDHTARVVAQMAALGVDETASIRVDVDASAGGIEAGAREARYAALGKLATHFGAALVLLGHTRDDQAETVLLGLARGSGGRSIAGMRRSFSEDGVHFVRPMLELSREQTEAACRAEDIEFWIDPHNADPRFLRARVRHDVLPVLERELGPGVAATLARTAEQLRPDMEFLDDFAEDVFDLARGRDASWTHGLGVRVRCDAVEGHGPAITGRVARLAALEAGCPPAELFAVHIDAVAELMVGSGRGRQIQLPGHVTAHRDGADLAFRRTGSSAG